ncbi:hypothetical protein caldi_34770 [Caldinitratiruptor microaerophilus]|uniref:HTH hxlR-type domain-containing protein n=1 Tax=Caldinitratiruptor microaerophilus TaxID=671077 RepID=A0AA35CNE2_9FIRM|nr:hypothetical protein caldi_34770 [Caldinitratiruptor microaerophilus]
MNVEDFCPIARTAELIGDVYVLLIVRDLAKGPRRFGELARSVRANSRTLSDRLRRLEVEGIVRRTAYPEIPPRVEYELTEKGRGLVSVLEAMRQYGTRWLLAGTAGGVGAGAPARGPGEGETGGAPDRG